MNFKSDKQKQYKFRKEIYYLILQTKEKLDDILMNYGYNPSSFNIKVDISPKRKEEK